MELSNHKLGEAVTTANEILQQQIESNAMQKVERVKSFNDFGFDKAGKNAGDFISLKVHLGWIKDGHIVEDGYDENEQHLLKNQLENKIVAKEEDKNAIDGEKRAASEVAKPAIEKKIKELTDEIQQTKIDLLNNKIQTGYHPEKYFLYVGLVLILALYLILFYASMIYGCFFRNAASLIQSAGSDITLMLDSIFDIKGIFTPSPVLIIAYLGAFIFFAIGYIPHTLEGKYKKITTSIFLFISLLIDSLMAYKIDLGIHNLKEMAGIADLGWHFYSSVNFYLVLVFGFVVYLVWGYLFEMMLKEKIKKTGTTKAALIIDGLKLEIKELRRELDVLNTKIIALETQIKATLAQLEQLKKDLENNMLNPNALSQNLTSFYMGWREYLNRRTDFILEKSNCDTAFNEFMNSQFNTIVNLN